MTTANYRDSNGNWKSWTPDMVGVAANANTLGGGTHIPKAAYGVVDYNNTGQTITLGYAGSGFTSSDFTYALGLNTSRQIKDVSKDEYRKWLGLGSAAYTASNAYAAASHSHTSLTDIDASSRQISISYAGDTATSINHLCCFVNNGTKIKDANEAAVKTLLGLNNVNNTADSNKSVKYADSAGYITDGVTIGSNYKTAIRTTVNGTYDTRSFIKPIRCDTASVDGAPQHGSGICFGRADTQGYLYVPYYAPGAAYIGGGNIDKLNWVRRIILEGDSISWNNISDKPSVCHVGSSAPSDGNVKIWIQT